MTDRSERGRCLGAGRFLQLVDDRGWEYVRRKTGTGVVAVIAVTDEGKLVLTEQDRPPVDGRVVDLPAGLAGDVIDQSDEEFTAAARRELIEETGFEPTSLCKVMTVPTSPGLTSETVIVYRADRIERVEAGGGDETEDIVVHTVPLPEVPQWLRERTAGGALIDPKVYLALWVLREG